MKLATLAGIAIVVAHGAGFAWLAARTGGSELVVEVAALVVRDASPGSSPGLHRRHWSRTCRGR